MKPGVVVTGGTVLSMQTLQRLQRQHVSDRISDCHNRLGIQPWSLVLGTLSHLHLGDSVSV